ncbi:MAG: 3-phosphoshikimate 1-carboxyvinyltransferase [Acidobacteriota bacterium]|nr:3-phosphoshikimate 1-carboxyvinyltransferase [Acidobacteriota bacterium]
MLSRSATAVQPARRACGRVRPPGDKSISHRYALLAALADGPSTIHDYAPGADGASMLHCLAALGVAIDRPAARQAPLCLVGRGLDGLRSPAAPLDAGNSGTAMRLLAGVLAGQPFTATLTGDASLSSRPMRRVIEPLTRMGARIESQEGHAPLVVHGGRLQAIEYAPAVPSAQVKSAVLLAGLYASGRTTVREPAATRDHTERALEAFGAAVERDGLSIALRGGQRLTGGTFRVPGDLSSAVFWLVAAAALPGSEIEIEGVGLNPTRTAILPVLERFGTRIDPTVERTDAGEPTGRIRVRHGDLRPVTIAPAEVPAIIDELPALAALAAVGAGLVVHGAGELRVKESDRITALVGGLRALGAAADEFPDGFHVHGGGLTGGTADAAGDHRLAMAFAIAALAGRAPSVITGADSVAVSYPGFFETLDGLRA